MRDLLQRYNNQSKLEELANIQQAVDMGGSQMGAGNHSLAPQIPEPGWDPPRGVVVQLD